jgi:regulator of protease activity HflC (stomatin/prohibitin superfamily)
MFDKLIDFIIKIGKDALPYVIVEQWNGAVQTRFGKFYKDLKPGIHLKLPFFDGIFETTVITQSVSLPAQTLTTQDEQTIVLKAIIRYHVSDVKKYLTEVEHANVVLVDTTQGMIRDIVEVTDWVNLVDVNNTITKKVKTFVKRWGISIERITITDLGIVKTYRILGDGTGTKVLPTEEERFN